MKGIIIPTFSGHFSKNVNFLKSARENISDLDDVVIRFITSNDHESGALSALLKSSELNGLYRYNFSSRCAI